MAGEREIGQPARKEQLRKSVLLGKLCTREELSNFIFRSY